MSNNLVVSVRGRGRKLVAEVNPGPAHGQFMVRVDDEARPDFWLEVVVDANQLQAMLNENESE